MSQCRHWGNLWGSRMTTVPFFWCGDKTCPLETATQHGSSGHDDTSVPCAGSPYPTEHPWVPHRAPGFCKLKVAKGLWDLLSCFPPLVLHVLHMAVQDLLSEGLGPLPGAQSATAPWPGFLSCLMVAGALNLSCGLPWVLRGQAGSAIPAMCPLSRDQQ